MLSGDNARTVVVIVIVVVVVVVNVTELSTE